MRIPPLGPRGEGWVVAQIALGALIVSAGIAGPEWSSAARTALLFAGIGIGIAGLALFITGVVALGSSLTPFPKPSEHSTLRSGGAYRLVRHPIYGGVLLLAIGWSVVLSPIALVVTALLAVVLELKARHEESMLAERFPEYEAYRRRVRLELDFQAPLGPLGRAVPSLSTAGQLHPGASSTTHVIFGQFSGRGHLRQ